MKIAKAEHISGGESQKNQEKCKGGPYFWQKIKKIDPIKGGGAKKQQNQMKP